jgi:hypothetical protein
MKTGVTPKKSRERNEISPIGKAKMIQERAYELFVQRGRIPGHELEDWLQAEREVCAPETHHETA